MLLLHEILIIKCSLIPPTSCLQTVATKSLMIVGSVLLVVTHHSPVRGQHQEKIDKYEERLDCVESVVNQLVQAPQDCPAQPNSTSLQQLQEHISNLENIIDGLVQQLTTLENIVQGYTGKFTFFLH